MEGMQFWLRQRRPHWAGGKWNTSVSEERTLQRKVTASAQSPRQGPPLARQQEHRGSSVSEGRLGDVVGRPVASGEDYGFCSEMGNHWRALSETTWSGTGPLGVLLRTLQGANMAGRRLLRESGEGGGRAQGEGRAGGGKRSGSRPFLLTSQTQDVRETTWGDPHV